MAGLKKSDVCVLIPAYNEAERLPGLLKEVLALGFTVAVADDGSRDGTVRQAKALGAAVLETDRNCGKGSAIRRGIRWFLQRPYRALILMDADGQHAPAELGLFLEALNEGRHDVILGNRMGSSRGMPGLRRMTNRLMSFWLSLLAGQKVPDTQCGYRAFTRAALEKLSLKADHFEIESEMLLEAARHGFLIGSIPISCVYGMEKSRINPAKDTVRFLKFLMSRRASR